MGQLQERYKNYREPQKFMEAGVYPYFREITGKQGTEVEMGGHKVLMFGSNAYTGLTGDQRIIDAAKAALDQYGSGCAGSRFLNGTLDLHVKLEKEISAFVHKDDCLCLSTGFSVNQGVLAMIVTMQVLLMDVVSRLLVSYITSIMIWQIWSVCFRIFLTRP